MIFGKLQIYIKFKINSLAEQRCTLVTVSILSTTFRLHYKTDINQMQDNNNPVLDMVYCRENSEAGNIYNFGTIQHIKTLVYSYSINSKYRLTSILQNKKADRTFLLQWKTFFTNNSNSNWGKILHFHLIQMHKRLGFKAIRKSMNTFWKKFRQTTECPY